MAFFAKLTGLTGGVLLCFTSGAQTPVPPVSIGVSQSAVARGTLYSYEVINHSAYPVTSVIIGFDYYSGLPKLETAPVGWTLDGGVPASSVTSPTGWAASITPTEDTNLLSLEWRVSAPRYAIPPGQTAGGFSILVPHADSTYVSSFWTVYVKGAAVTHYSGPFTANGFRSEGHLRKQR